VKSFIRGIRLVPVASTSVSLKGDLEVLDSSSKINYFNGTSSSPLVAEAHAATLTNKTISGASNTLTSIAYSSLVLTNSIVNADIAAGAAIAYSKLSLVGAILNADLAGNIARSKLAAGSADHVVINDGSGNLSSESQLAISRGGTGQSTQTAAFDALSPTTTKGDIIVSNGTDNIRLPVGTNSQVLAADSAQASGLIWTNSAVADNSITEFKLTTSVAGNGLTGGNGTPLAVNVDTNTITIVTDTLQLAAVGQQISSSSGSITTTSAAYVDATNLTISITTTGRPVFVGLISDGSGTSGSIRATHNSNITLMKAEFAILKDSTIVGSYSLENLNTASGAFDTITVPSSCVWFIDTPIAGTYTYKLQYRATSPTTAGIINTKLIAYQIK
jgi:hypothetical protein